jgi:hypothetical protein
MLGPQCFTILLASSTCYRDRFTFTQEETHSGRKKKLITFQFLPVSRSQTISVAGWIILLSDTKPLTDTLTPYTPFYHAHFVILVYNNKQLHIILNYLKSNKWVNPLNKQFPSPVTVSAVTIHYTRNHDFVKYAKYRHWEQIEPAMPTEIYILQRQNSDCKP